jgi:hypothetical protein
VWKRIGWERYAESFFENQYLGDGPREVKVGEYLGFLAASGYTLDDLAVDLECHAPRSVGNIFPDVHEPGGSTPGKA